ncbi:MAG TPA: nucleotidyltransferase family protein [Candidatus Obscuribacterales bacterium]
MAENAFRLTHNYWVRPGYGRSLKLERIGPLWQESAGERLVAALLRGDRDSARAELSALRTVELVKACGQHAGQIVNLIYDRIWQLGLAEQLAEHSASSDTSLFEMLRASTTAASLRSTRYNDIFLRLLDVLEDSKDAVVWIKGPVLARTLYKKPEFRISVDFDFIVKPECAQQILNRLESEHFQPLWDACGHSHPFGTGPVGSLHNISLTPSREYEPFHDITLRRDGWPLVEIKSDPWNRGLKANELDRFFGECEPVLWEGRTFFAPSVVDHLIIQLVHFHKHGFHGWHWLYDIHLLIGKISECPRLWTDFVRRCRAEGTDISAWAGLEIARDRLASLVPTEVLDELAPSSSMFSNVFTFTVSPEFLWNAESLPMLLLNAVFLGDQRRKVRVLLECLAPSRQFLSDYYCGGAAKLNCWRAMFLLLVHWLVLTLPSGLVRLTFGRFLWAQRPNNVLSSPKAKRVTATAGH